MKTESFVISNGELVKYDGCEKEVVIPFGVEVIGNDAFKDNDFIVSVEIPEGVREIRIGAFNRCVKLEKIIMPSSLKKIGMGAFARCVSLKTVDIPESVTDIGCSAFLDCYGLKTVNYNAVRCRNIRSEGNYNYYTYSDYGNFYDDIFPVFYGCKAFKTVNIGADVEYVPSELFRCSDIRTVNINSEKKLKIGFNAFSNDADLNKIFNCNTHSEIVFEPFKICLFPSVEVMPGAQIMHKMWGEGTVIEVIPEKNIIKVGFSFLGVKSFLFPDTFLLGILKVID